MIKLVCYIINLFILSALLSSSCSAYSIHRANALELKDEKTVEDPEVIRANRRGSSLHLQINPRVKFTSNFMTYALHRIIITQTNTNSQCIIHAGLSSTDIPLYIAYRHLLI